MKALKYILKMKSEGFYPKNILDIGANIGDFSLFCNRLFPESYIFMIEGNGNCENDLFRTGLDYKIALLGDQERDVQFHFNPADLKSTGSSYYKENTKHFENSITETKRLQKLDKLLQEKFISQNQEPKIFDFIKMDTQGSELDIVKGGVDTIKKSSYVMLEVSYGHEKYNQGAPTYEETINTMHSLGFESNSILQEHYHNGNICQVDVLFENTLL